MWLNVAQGVLIPFAGTALGAACVFFLRRGISDNLNKVISGFAAGIMVAASFFSLIMPALEQSKGMGSLAFLPSAIGFLIGMLFLLALDMVIPHIHLDKSEEGPGTGLKKTTKFVLAVTLHNIPEGIAAGIVFAGWVYGNESITLMGAFALSLGIALQNFPEGAIVSLSLNAEGMNRRRAFVYGALSGIVEPIFAMLAIFAAGFFLPVLPYLLAFAAGAMFYVVVEELIPEMAEGRHSNIGTVSFTVGFVLMMILDVALG